MSSWPRPTPESPWPVLFSGCLAGWLCGVDGTAYGGYPTAQKLIAIPGIRAVPFCPEEVAYGVPRPMPDLYGGDGHAVLDGTATVRLDGRADGTEAMVAAARQMVEVARLSEVRFALLMDMSGACGSQVVSDGNRLVPQHERRYQKGFGVAAAALVRAGIPVVSQRDFRTLDHLFALLDDTHVPDPAALDHHEKEWYRSYFQEP